MQGFTGQSLTYNNIPEFTRYRPTRQKKSPIENQPNNRKSIRLKGYDYSLPGAYFITLLTYQCIELFGHVESGEVILNQYGQVVFDTVEKLHELYPYMVINPFIIMPDHFHGVIRIIELSDECKGGSRPALTEMLKIKPLGQLIGAFKTLSAKKINLLRSTPGSPVWHRNYYDHIIHNDDEFRKIWDYIDTNPQNWDHNRLHTLE